VLRAQNKLPEALDSYRKSLAIREALVETNAENVLWRGDLNVSINKIGSTASFLVLAKDFAQALDAANQTIALAPEKVWLYTNRAHALMFLGRVDEARTLYLQHRDAPKTEETPAWVDMVLFDFAEMRKAGLTHPLMDEIETQFGQAKTAEPNAPQPEQASQQ
jgi:tetratricopeptide (TPR) repeat protein